MLLTLGLIVVGCACHGIRAKNAYGDHGIIFTALPAEIDEEYQNIISVPNMPNDIDNTTEEYPGFNFGFLFRRPISCAVDYAKNELYVYDYHLRGLLLLQNFNSSAMKPELTITRQHYGISREYVKLAVDWISHNIYWTDPLMNWIAMQPGGAINDPSKYKVIIQEHLQLPRAIAVDPINGYLFWADFSVNPVIERSSLTGENRQKLIFNQLTDPSAIVADHVSKRIYWTDLQFIDSATYDGTQRMHIVRESNVRYFDVALYEDVLITTDIQNYFSGEIPYSAKFYNKTTGKEMKDKRINTTREAYFGVCLYTERVQPERPDLDKCKDAGCQDMCVNEASGAKCVCREGYLLATDSRTCIELGGQHQRAVVVNTGTSLCLLDIRVLSDHHDYSPVCFYNGTDNETISYFDVDNYNREVYFSVKKIVYRVAIDAGFDGNYGRRTQLAEHNADIIGMSFDYINEFLYYGVAADLQEIWYIEVLQTSSYYLGEVANGNISSLTVIPHSGRGYWIANENTLQTLDLLTVPGSTLQITDVPIDIPLVNPKHMVHDSKYELLYALIEGYDEHTDLMGIEYNGSVSHYLATDRPVIDFAIYKEYVVLVNKDDDGNYQIRTGDLGLGMPLQIVDEGAINGLDTIAGIKILDVSLQASYPNPCGTSTDNGGCEGICLPNGDTSTCACNIGFTLQGKRCVSTSVTDDFILVSDVTYNEIFQISLKDTSKVIAIRTPDIGRPDGVIYNYLNDEMLWSNSFQAQLWTVTLNGSREHLFGDIGVLLAYPDRIALDPSTGNVYYTAVSYYAAYDSSEMGQYYGSYIGVINKNGETAVVVLEGLHRPRDIVLDPSAGYMFWTDHGSSSPGIYRANMDGSDKTDLHVTDVVWPNGLAIDVVNKHIYWVDGYLDRIYRSDYTNRDSRVIFLEVAKGLQMTDVDLVGNYLYYTASGENTITRVNKNNKNDIKQIGPEAGLGVLYALDVYSSTANTNIPVNADCSQNNGGCSHFCFPTNGGYSCGCEYYYNLLPDGKTCENALLCPQFIPNGLLTWDNTCVGGEGNTCAYTCYEGYTPKTGKTTITCTSELDAQTGQLKWDMADPCEVNLCPKNIGNGILDASCLRRPGETCSYTCADGSKPNMGMPSTSLLCKLDGTWNLKSGIENICKKTTCPDKIQDGEINESCSLLPGTVCTFKCTGAFKVNPKSDHLMCANNGTWNSTSSGTTPCIADAGKTAASSSSKGVALGVGLGVGILVLIIIIVIVLVFCIRMGKISSPFGKRTEESHATTFENPRYVGNNVQLGETESTASFGYTTLHDDRVSIANTLPQSSAAHATNGQYDKAFS